MSQPPRNTQAATANARANPCVRNCCLDEHDVCLGCGRTLQEITGWSTLSTADREQVLRQANARLSAKRRF